jgi:glycosyltransferase involved in cell wall biosynthesis
MAQELVSVIIPAYNAAKYLRDAVEGALNQIYSQREIIVVDDGSTDTTPQVLAEYGDKIQVIRQSNKGTAAACNVGVAAAQGTWITFLDADDIWLPEKLARQIEYCRDTVVSHTDSICFGAGLTSEIRRSSFEPPYSGKVLKNLLVRNFITKSTVMMRRDVYLALGGFNESYMAVEDWPFFLKVCAEHELGYCPEPVVRYRVHTKSKSMQGRKTMADHLRIINEAFSAEGVGKSFPELRAKALASSYQINCHYSAESGDWAFAIYCAVQALRYEPAALHTWKSLAKSTLIPLGIEY